MDMEQRGLGESDITPNIISHHEVLARLDAFDTERGAKIAGHRGFFLTNDGLDLNQALINYGLQFLRERGYKKIQTPFMMRKDMMAKTAQLDQFDEELYHVCSVAQMEIGCANAGLKLFVDCRSVAVTKTST